MRQGLAAIVFSIMLAAVAALAAAAPFTASFDPLRAELQRRHDEDYGGTLTRTQRKELAAIDASLARIDGAHASITDDAKSLRFVAGRLAKGFRGEFTGDAPGPLAGLVAGTASSLLTEAEGALGSLQDAVAGAVDPQVRDRVTTLAATARAQLDAAAEPGIAPTLAAARLLRSLKTIAKGVAVANEGKADRLVCTMNGRAYAATEISADVGVVTDQPYIVIFATLQNPVTNRRERLTLVMHADVGVPTEIGAFVPFGPNYMAFGLGETQSGFFFSQFSPKSTFTITGFDAESRTATGTFSCFLQREGQLKLTMTKGAFRVTGDPLPMAK